MVDMIFPTPTNVSTLGQALQYLNSLTDVGSGGNIGIIIMIVLFGGMFMMMRGYAGVKRAFGVATCLNAFIAALFIALNFINNYMFYGSLIMGAIGLWMLIGESSKYE